MPLLRGTLFAALLPLAFASSGCTSYQYAKNVAWMSFDGKPTEGEGVGPVRGESCQAAILGIQTDEPPTLDKAVADARKQSSLRYMTNVSTSNSGLNAIVYTKRCLVVKGTGYK